MIKLNKSRRYYSNICKTLTVSERSNIMSPKLKKSLDILAKAGATLALVAEAGKKLISLWDD